MLLLAPIIFASCVKMKSSSEIKTMLNSGDKHKIIEATNYVVYNKEYGLVKEVLEKSDDPRVFHDLHHKGISVYQIKMIGMKKLTGIQPPKKITDDPDSIIIKFYINEAKKRSWLD